MPLKPIICIDFDGVLNNYRGYDGDNLGTPKQGAKEFLEKLSKRFTVIILTVRRYSLVIKWLVEYNMWDYVQDVTSIKPAAVCYVDDRGINFNGDYDKALKDINNFKTYWEK